MTAQPLVVYYDASCALCRSEMEVLTSRDVSGRLLLVDCSAADFKAPEGISRQALMSRIHARDSSGAWLRGVDVFAAAYEAAGLPRIARMLRNPLLRSLFGSLYPWIADHRQALSSLGLARALRIVGRADCRSCTTIRGRAKV